MAPSRSSIPVLSAAAAAAARVAIAGGWGGGAGRHRGKLASPVMPSASATRTQTVCSCVWRHKIGRDTRALGQTRIAKAPQPLIGCLTDGLTVCERE
jgi:hypothetical protein